MSTLLSTAYWPNLQYFYLLLNSDCLIECFDNYNKQSFRNRTIILSANGLLELTIPIAKSEPKQLTKEIRISYGEKWQIKHWRAITSAYRNSAYFEYFEDIISAFYSIEYEKLLDYNTAQIRSIFKILKLKKEFQFTSEYRVDEQSQDFRDNIHPKIKNFSEPLQPSLLQPYRQVFDEKYNFQPNLSILDLVFNMGLETKDYLAKK